MAHGAPDASNVVMIGQDYRLDDMAELGARLGSVMTYRRTGDLFFSEDFSHGMGSWIWDAVPPASFLVLQSDITLSGGVALECTTAAVGLATTEIHRYFPLSTTGRIGAGFGYDAGTNKERFEVTLGGHDGTNRYYGNIHWNLATHHLQYRPRVGANVLIDILHPALIERKLFTQFKLVVDFTLLEYVSLAVNEVTYDLSGILLPFAASSSRPSYYVNFTCTGNAGGIYSSYLDNVILTRNEG